MTDPVSKVEELRAFCEVAEARSFTAAAATLGCSTSSVSKHVRSLEISLGVRLLGGLAIACQFFNIATKAAKSVRDALASCGYFVTD